MNKKLNLCGKINAFLIHLLLSASIFLAIFFALKYFFYPDPLFEMDGGKQGLKIIAFVDIVLGPLLTFAVYKKNKPGLKKDLSLIGALQIACLAAGVYITIIERPLALVLSYDGFHSINQSSLALYDETADLFEKWPGRSPKLLYVKLPEDRNEKLNLQFSQLSEGPLYIRKNLLSTFNDDLFKPDKYSFSLEEVIRQYPSKINELKTQDKRLKKQKTEFFYVNLIAKYGSCYVIFDTNRQKILSPVFKNHCKG